MWGRSGLFSESEFFWKDIHGKKCSCGKQFKDLLEYTPLPLLGEKYVSQKKNNANNVDL